MYKGKRYNAVIICLLFIISIVVGFSAGMAPNTTGNSNVEDISDQFEQEYDDIEAAPAPEGMVVPGPDASAFERIAFAVDVLEHGAGFTSQVSQTLSAMGQKQQMIFLKYRGGKYDFTEEWLKMGGFLSSLGKNEFRSYFSDGVNMKYKVITNPSNYNFDKKTYNPAAADLIEQFTVDKYVNGEFRNPINSFFTTIDASTATIKSYNKRHAKYYEITVELNVKKLNPRYLTTFTSNGGSNVDIKSIILTFKIDKETGYFRSMKKVETFGAKYLGYEAICETNLTETFMTMNKSSEEIIKQKAAASFGIKF
jgi:hypothetical protein